MVRELLACTSPLVVIPALIALANITPLKGGCIRGEVSVFVQRRAGTCSPVIIEVCLVASVSELAVVATAAELSENFACDLRREVLIIWDDCPLFVRGGRVTALSVVAFILRAVGFSLLIRSFRHGGRLFSLGHILRIGRARRGISLQLALALLGVEISGLGILGCLGGLGWLLLLLLLLLELLLLLISLLLVKNFVLCAR